MKKLRDSKEQCPECGAEFQGSPIPEEQQEAFGATHFSRKISIYSREKDRTVAWLCPDCNHKWAR